MNSYLGEWGGVSHHQLTVFQHSRFGPYVFTIIDCNSVAVNLDGKTVKLTLWKPGVPSVSLHTLSSTDDAVGISSTDHNVVTCTGDDELTAVDGLLNFQLDDTTTDRKLGVGTVVVKPACSVT